MSTGLENLKIYKLAEELEVDLYETTSKFPRDEKYRSVDQIRRSSSAATNNIAEGYNRYSYKEKIHFFYTAKAEAEETKRNILRASYKGFLEKELADLIADKYTEFIKCISGYIRFLREKLGGNNKT